jgi:DNA invertase Pin-like site-specific DNA recombinase
MKAAIYARVSTLEQDYRMQVTELRTYCLRMGFQAVEYLETASGKSGGKRPELARLLADARLHKFDAVIVWKVDRFGRSVRDFLNNVLILDSARVRFISPNQGIDTDRRSAYGNMLMNILAVFAEFERDIIVERVRAGLSEYKRAFAAGQVGKVKHSKSGKDLPAHRPFRVFRRDKARELRARGLSWNEIAERLHVPRSTVRRELARK